MGERLNEWVIKKMDAQNLSMRKLGETIGVGHGYISRVLNGKQNAGLEFYLKIARAFDAVPEFLREAEILPEISADAGLTYSQISGVVDQLDEEGRKALLDYSDFLLSKHKHKP